MTTGEYPAPPWVMDVLANGDAHLLDGREPEANVPLFRAWYRITDEGVVLR